MKMQDRSNLGLQSAISAPERSSETANVINAQMFRSGADQHELVSGRAASLCTGCLNSEGNLCAKVQEKIAGTTSCSASNRF